MCVIIHKPAGVEIPAETLEACADDNPDGWGLMYHDGGRTRAVKSRHMAEFQRAYDRVRDCELGIHFRWRTHGDVNNAMAHPYPILDLHGSTAWLMHNGVLPIATPDKTKSDTWTWISKALRPMLRSDPGLWDQESFWRFIEHDTYGSRLLFLDGRGEFRRTGHFQDWEGCSYSNLNWRRGLSWLSDEEEYEEGVPWGGSGRHNGMLDGALAPDLEPLLDMRVDDAMAELRRMSLSDLEDLCETDPRLAAELLQRLAYG